MKHRFLLLPACLLYVINAYGDGRSLDSRDEAVCGGAYDPHQSAFAGPYYCEHPELCDPDVMCCDADETFRGCCAGHCCYQADGTVSVCCRLDCCGALCCSEEGSCCSTPDGDPMCCPPGQICWGPLNAPFCCPQDRACAGNVCCGPGEVCAEEVCQPAK